MLQWYIMYVKILSISYYTYYTIWTKSLIFLGTSQTQSKRSCFGEDASATSICARKTGLTHIRIWDPVWSSKFCGFQYWILNDTYITRKSGISIWSNISILILEFQYWILKNMGSNMIQRNFAWLPSFQLTRPPEATGGCGIDGHRHG